jgi:hypothetical protein
MKNITVVLVEDSQDDILLIRREIIKRGWGLFVLPTLEDARREIVRSLSVSESEVYALLLDACIPNSPGFDPPRDPNTMEIISLAKDWGFTWPIIAISGEDQNNSILLAAGATHKSSKKAIDIVNLIASILL